MRPIRTTLVSLTVLAAAAAIAAPSALALDCGCSPATVDDIDDYDLAVVGTVIEARERETLGLGGDEEPIGTLLVIRVEASNRNSLEPGEEIEVLTGSGDEGCSISSDEGRRNGLLLEELGTGFTGRACDTIDPDELADALDDLGAPGAPEPIEPAPAPASGGIGWLLIGLLQALFGTHATVASAEPPASHLSSDVVPACARPEPTAEVLA